MEPHVTFRSDAFNTSELREDFMNAGCFGEDVALWLIGALRARGIDVDPEAGQEDFGWFLRFRVGGVSHCLILTLIPGDEDQPVQWALWFERDAGFFSTLLGGRRKGISPIAIRVLRGILEASPEIREVEWAAKRP